jgi:superfamily II DNA or RNA helicase
MELSATGSASAIRVGDRVWVRRERWVVAGVEPHDGCTLVTLTATDPAASPRTFRVLSPFDDLLPDTRVGRSRRVGMRAWRRASRSLVAADGPAGSLRTAVSARMELLPYQLEPALALLHGHGCRILIADDVGLGKTVQAALAITELRASGAAARVLILCPAGLRDQWVEECRTRFDLDVAPADPAALRRRRATLPPGANPWTLDACVVASIDYVKRPEVLPLLLEAPWDVVVVDEAHGAAGASDRHDAVMALCRTASYVLLLTATPHNGNEEAFAALCATGALDEPLLVFRRSRAQAGVSVDRRIHTVRVRPSAPELAMHAALRTFAAAVRHEGADRDRQVWLLLALLHKRACSSPYALGESVRRRLDALQGEAADSCEQQFLLPLDEGGELDGADAAPMWAQPALSDGARERSLLRAILAASRAAESADSKLRRLARLLVSLREPVIVFTEYRDTLLHVQQCVVPHAMVVHGGLTREERRRALESFRQEGGVLLATDAAGEGLNLQHGCRTVVNLELPWNPMRLEQRIGRVDRIGQRRRVHAFHLVSDRTGECRLLERLAARIARAGARVGAPDPLGTPPPWTESAAEQLVIEGSSPSLQPDPQPAESPSMPLVRFELQAADECHRLWTVRRAIGSRDGERPGSILVDHATALVASTTRRRTRLATRGRALALFRSQLTDATGRVVASHVTALLLEVLPDAPGMMEAIARAGVETGIAERASWLAVSIRRHARLSATRLRRIAAIAAACQEVREAHQPGLFDRRVEHDHAEALRARLDRFRELEDRRQHAEAACMLTVSPPVLTLLLLPGRLTRR